MLIARRDLELLLHRMLKNNPVAAIIGPRQCGKTTLARVFGKEGGEGYFDLEDPISRRRLDEPMLALRPLRGLVVIDEVQRMPELFEILRVLADRRPLPARFLLLGSASPDLARKSTESLAGRVAYLEMGGFGVTETEPAKRRSLWLRGGLPRSFLARSDRESYAWRENFIQTFIERDLGAALGTRVSPPAMQRLWSMIAHYHGQTWNVAEIARALGEAEATVKRHLDVFTGALMVRPLQPWYTNTKKRLVKAPKVYIRDTGLLHALLGIEAFAHLEGHPKCGASWEGFVVEEIARAAGNRSVFYWATHSGAEVDLLLQLGTKLYGVEVKYSDAPRLTKSMHIVREDLGLERLFVVYPGDQEYALDETTTAIPLDGMLGVLKRLAGRAPALRAAG